MSELTARRGVAETQLAVNKIRWFFREQPISDQGVDAIVEDVHPEPSEVGTGRLLALQIKGGPSWFRRPSAEGWWFRFDAGHASRWLNLPIPVAVVLVDDEAGVCYWQEISPSTIIKAGKGFKVEVPKAQTVPDASQAWRDLASKAVAEAELLYENSIAHLPPPVGNGLKGLRPAHPADAALIAYHLAEGRNNAGGSVSALLAAEPTWLKRCAPRSWVIIGDYASAHDLNLYAAECYERACLASDEAEPDRGRWFSAAATQLVYSDRTRAAALVDEASSCGASPAVVAVLRAAIDHPEGDASAIPVPDFLDLEGETVRKSAFVQSFLAIQAQRRGDSNAALLHSSLAISADAESSTAMAHRADILLWAALAGHSDHQLQVEALERLRACIDQRQQWNGPTLDPTLELARAGLLYGQMHLTLDACLAAPDGTATDEVAQDGRVKRMSLAAAIGLRRPELAQRIADSMSSSEADLLTKHRAGLLDASDDQRTGWLQTDLADALASDDFMRVAQDALELAHLGIDSTDALQPLLKRSILPADTSRFISAVATARTDLDAAIPHLRALARTNRQAGAVLVDLLQGVGRIPEAIQACDAILMSRREPAAIAARVQLLITSGHKDAEEEALKAAGELEGFSTVRRDFLTFAAQKAAQRNDWDLAERRLQDALAIPGPPDDDLVWWLASAQVNLGRVDRARYTIDKHHPEVASITDAEVWIQAHASTTLDATNAAHALALAEKFDHPKISTALLGLIVTATNGVDPDLPPDEADEDQLEERRRVALTSVPAELHKNAFRALDRLVKKHGDSTGIVILKGSDQTLTTQLIELMRARREHDEVLADWAQKAQVSQMPLGLLAAAAGRSYATTLIQRALGLLPAASPLDDENDLEVDAAAAALNGTVVADASSLLTTTGIPVDSPSYFAAVTIPPSVLRDIHRARADIRGASGSPGSLGLDHASGTPVITRLPPDEFLRQLKRSEALLELATSLPVRLVSEHAALPDFADEPRFHPWSEPIELAHQLSCSLWSDDLALRRVARDLGIPAFGTPALLTAVNEREVAAADAEVEGLIERAAANNLALAADCLVDIRLAFGDVVRLAQRDDWRPLSGALALSRPSWWAWSQMRMEELVPLFRTVRSNQPGLLADWQVAAMLGAARAIIDPTVRGRVLCTIALLGFDADEPGQDLRDGVLRARSVASNLGLPDPAIELPDIARTATSDGGDEIDNVIASTILSLADELGVTNGSPDQAATPGPVAESS